MSSTPTPVVAAVKSVSQVLVQATKSVPAHSTAAQSVTQKRGYGLPCAKCRTYYSSDLASCPVCKHADRVKPSVAPVAPVASPGTELSVIEREREKFLREFKSQVYASHVQINTAESFRCTLDSNHQGGFEPAAVCQECYDHLKERLDLAQAALHMDAADAAQVVYDAVWADTSDPNKTYQHAAEALLTELRKRAGISQVLGRHQPKAH